MFVYSVRIAVSILSSRTSCPKQRHNSTDRLGMLQPFKYYAVIPAVARSGYIEAIAEMMHWPGPASTAFSASAARSAHAAVGPRRPPASYRRSRPCYRARNVGLLRRHARLGHQDAHAMTNRCIPPISRDLVIALNDHTTEASYTCITVKLPARPTSGHSCHAIPRACHFQAHLQTI